MVHAAGLVDATLASRIVIFPMLGSWEDVGAGLLSMFEKHKHPGDLFLHTFLQG